MGELIEKLEKLADSDMYPFHMPGHKRNIQNLVNPYKYDITEIEGFDNLHAPEDIFVRLNDRINKIYKAKESYILVNGSTSGILSAISACVKPNETLLLDRNSHKSAYNAVFLRQLKTEYIYPHIENEMGITSPIEPEQVEKALCRNQNIKAVFITSPSYEGVISDIEAISKVCHRHNTILIVDSAHGAHFGLHKNMPQNAVTLGANIVIMSIHKTLPAFTQTAIMCINGNLVNSSNIKKYTDIYVSSSPSYILLSSVEKCMDIIEKEGQDLFEHYFSILNEFRNNCRNLKKLHLFESCGEYDIGKIVICTEKTDIDGAELKRILHDKYSIEIEMASNQYVIAMTSIFDTKEGFDRLLRALKEIDNTVNLCEKNNIFLENHAEKFCEIYEADNYSKKIIPYHTSSGCISAGYIYAYPPGIPWLTPGEYITEDIINNITDYLNRGLNIQGLIQDCNIEIIVRK